MAEPTAAEKAIQLAYERSWAGHHGAWLRELRALGFDVLPTAPSAPVLAEVYETLAVVADDMGEKSVGRWLRAVKGTQKTP